MAALGSSELNGEIYLAGMHLQDIMAATVKTRAGVSELLEFHIFDIADSQQPYEVRCSKLHTLVLPTACKVKVVRNRLAHNFQQIDEAYNEAMSRGCEGLMVKNAKGLYVHNTRSHMQFKYKKMLDCEKQIIDYNIDKNGHPVFVVDAGNGKEFKVKLKGTNEQRLQVLEGIENLMGQWLNISYETLSKDGICLKPVGNYIRPMTKGEPAV
jgi:ATP-dependent DNA ligase